MISRASVSIMIGIFPNFPKSKYPGILFEFEPVHQSNIARSTVLFSLTIVHQTVGLIPRKTQNNSFQFLVATNPFPRCPIRRTFSEKRPKSQISDPKSMFGSYRSLQNFSRSKPVLAKSPKGPSPEVEANFQLQV
jgi:hypothetical protein